MGIPFHRRVTVLSGWAYDLDALVGSGGVAKANEAMRLTFATGKAEIEGAKLA